MVQILRDLIGDSDNPQTYTDARLQQVIVTSAQLVLLEVDFDNTYTVDVFNVTISPDPVSLSEVAFINLVSIKAACMLAGAELRAAAGKAYSIKDGPSSIDGRSPAEFKKQMKDSICSEYAKAVKDYKLGGGTPGRAIVGPYTTESISYNTVRDRDPYFS